MQHYRLLKTLLFAFLIPTTLFACGGGGSSTPTAPPPTLSGLALSAGEISPSFSATISSYTFTTMETTTTVTATAGDETDTITVNGVATESGNESAEIALADDDTLITVTITREDGSASQDYLITARRIVGIELVDPTPGESDFFGGRVFPLPNGNIVVAESGDDTLATSGGAVHLYSPSSSTPISSIYGESSSDILGSNKITVLPNGNYVITSAEDDVDGISNAGSVRLMDGSTGEQIAMVAGDVADDRIGLVHTTDRTDGVTVLANGNYVISTRQDDENGVRDVGSVRLIDGTTGVQIAIATGTNEFDNLGSSGVEALANGNYVIASSSSNHNGVENSGSVQLMDGTTGQQIGSTFAGDNEDDLYGRSVTPLASGNFVIESRNDQVIGLDDAGSVQLVNGGTGQAIGPPISGDQEDDFLGHGRIVGLDNGNYIISSDFDNVAGRSDAGSVRLISGSDGEQIGMIAGNVANDRLGQSGITVLANGNYVVSSSSDNENGLSRAGSVRLVSGETGLQIGPAVVGNVAFDRMGVETVKALSTSNYVIPNSGDSENGIENAGTVRLIDGTTGIQIGNILVGDSEDDRLGLNGISVLPNNNYVISSSDDSEAGISRAGSVRLMDGETAEQIGDTIIGELENDQLGENGSIALPNNNFIVVSPSDNENGVEDAGSVRLVSGVTAVPFGSFISGDEQQDQMGSGGITVLEDNSYIVTSTVDSENGLFRNGSVRLASGETGGQVGATIAGESNSDMNNAISIQPEGSDYYILGQPSADRNGIQNSGMLRIIVP